MNTGYNYRNVLYSGNERVLYLFIDDDFVCPVRAGEVANSIRNTTPEREEGIVKTYLPGKVTQTDIQCSFQLQEDK